MEVEIVKVIKKVNLVEIVKVEKRIEIVEKVQVVIKDSKSNKDSEKISEYMKVYIVKIGDCIG